MADSVDILEFVPTINRILEESDLNIITARDVRMQLEKEFNMDLTSLKHDVQKLIDRCYDDLDIDDDDVEEFKIEPKIEPKTYKPKKQSNSEEKPKKLSSEKKKGTRPKGRPPKTQVKNRDSEYSSLEDDLPPKKKRGRKPKSSSIKLESSDAEFERRFQEELSNGKKLKSKSTTKKKSNKRKKRDDDEQDGEEPKKRKKGNTGIHKPLILSRVLADFLKAEEMSRLEVVKRLWEYIKENELQDPNDKRYIVCDERLMTIFKQTRIHSFTMNKFLTEHLNKKEAPAGANADIKNIKNINGAAAKHYENRSVDEDNDLDDVSRDENLDVKVKIESRENWEFDNDNEDGDEELFRDDDSEYVKPEDDDDKSQ